MTPPPRPLGSTVGSKLLMAATGVLLLAFVAGHLLGNLQIFLPPEAINRYAHFLQSTPELLWPVRLGLLALIGLHVYAAIRLTRENRAARPVPYAGSAAPYATTYAARTMLVSGLMVAAFVAYHLLHYTARVKAVNLTGVDFTTLRDPRSGHLDVYAMVIYGFSSWPVSVFYLAGVGLLCLHLSHGIQAMFQSLGLLNEQTRPWIARAARWMAILIFAGYASIPVAVLCGHGRAHLAAQVHPAATLGPAAAK